MHLDNKTLAVGWEKGASENVSHFICVADGYRGAKKAPASVRGLMGTLRSAKIGS